MTYRGSMPVWLGGTLGVLLVIASSPWWAFGPAPEPIVAADTARSVIRAANPPDAPTITMWSRAAGVPAEYALAIAWEETRWSQAPYVRSAVGAIGRFQIMPATARERCPNHNVRTYYGGLGCFLKMSQENMQTCRNDFRCMARIHNGAGPKAEVFADSVWSTITQIVQEEVSR